MEINFSQDYENAIEIANESLDSFSLYWFKFWLKRSRLVEAKLNNKKVAVALIFITDTICGKTGVIEYMIVRKEYRRKGIATEMIKWIENYFRSKGCEFVFASTRKENVASIMLFVKNNYKVLLLDCIVRRLEEGFEIIRKLQAYEDDLLFIKKLKNKDCILFNLEECYYM
jgi:ribosomal protein S18 acetylase RimI-like enzyme